MKSFILPANVARLTLGECLALASVLLYVLLATWTVMEDLT